MKKVYWSKDSDPNKWERDKDVKVHKWRKCGCRVCTYYKHSVLNKSDGSMSKAIVQCPKCLKEYFVKFNGCLFLPECCAEVRLVKILGEG